MTSDAAGRTLADEEGTTYAYDVFGRLSRASQFEGKTYDFTYDALGRLESWDDGSEEIALLYAGGKIIRTTDSAGDTWVLPGATEVPPVQIGVHSTRYLHGGWGGRLEEVTDEAGDVVEAYHYTAFGDVSCESPPGVAADASTQGIISLIGGQPYLAGLGLHSMGQRFYRPKWGRFLRPDPAGFLEGPNRYAFVANQPLVFWDPTGLGKKGAGLFVNLGLYLQGVVTHGAGTVVSPFEAIGASLDSTSTTVARCAHIDPRRVGDLNDASSYGQVQHTLESAYDAIDKNGIGTATWEATPLFDASEAYAAGAIHLERGEYEAAGASIAAAGHNTQESLLLGAEITAAGAGAVSLTRGALARTAGRAMVDETLIAESTEAGASKGGAGKGLAGQTRKQLLKSKRSYEELIVEHEKKLADYRADPFAYDNKGTLRAAPEHIRPKIIEGRIRRLEAQLSKQRGELRKIKDLLGE